MPERLKLWHDACTFCFWHMPAVYLLPNSRTHFLTRYAREIAGSSFGVIAKKGGRMVNASTNTTLSRRACQMPGPSPTRTRTRTRTQNGSSFSRRKDQRDFSPGISSLSRSACACPQPDGMPYQAGCILNEKKSATSSSISWISRPRLPDAGT
jgi:hypothetical protein